MLMKANGESCRPAEPRQDFAANAPGAKKMDVSAHEEIDSPESLDNFSMNLRFIECSFSRVVSSYCFL